MSLFKGSLLILAVFLLTISATEIWPGEVTKGRTFTVKSINPSYGYLRRYGYYAPDKLDLLEFSAKRRSGRFRFLSSNVIQEVVTRKCLNLINATNLQLVLKSACSGSVDNVTVPTWSYDSSSRHLVNVETKKCLSVWSYLDRPPPTVDWVPGLNYCEEYNEVILKYAHEDTNEDPVA